MTMVGFWEPFGSMIMVLCRVIPTRGVVPMYDHSTVTVFLPRLAVRCGRYANGTDTARSSLPAGNEDRAVSVPFAYLPHRTANRGRKTVTVLWSYIGTTPRVGMTLHNTIIMEPKGSQNPTIVIQEDGRSDFTTLGRSQECPKCRRHQIRKDMRDDGVNDHILP